MPDREKVIKGLEYCIADEYCDECPYTDDCFAIDDKPYGERLMRDALELLKSQPQIVRCKDCVYWQDNNSGYPHIGCKWREDETPDQMISVLPGKGRMLIE